MRIYDADGAERDWEWARKKYNLPPIIEAPKDKDHWEVVALHENCRDSSMTVRLILGDSLGPWYMYLEVADIPIAFSWPDAPFKSLPEEPKPRHVAQLTNANGDAGFGMGGGAYYSPPNVGPHAVWVAMYPDHPSDCVDGLGMLGRRDHWHLEPTFQFLAAEGPGPGPGECEECPRYRKALSEVHRIVAEALG